MLLHKNTISNQMSMSITILGIKYDINLQTLDLSNNNLSSLPAEILKIKNIISIDETSYDINNINMENEILIFRTLKIKLSNLPINTKEIWLNKSIINYEIKTPFNCAINFF